MVLFPLSVSSRDDEGQDHELEEAHEELTVGRARRRMVSFSSLRGPGPSMKPPMTPEKVP